MPPQQRARKTAATEPDTTIEESPGSETTVAPEEDVTSPEPTPEAPTAAEPGPGPICGDCFPGGWGALPSDTATAGCEHGTYTR